MSNGTYVKVMVQGRLGSDPETRYSANGNALTTLRIATNNVRKDKNTGERIDETEWHNIVLFNKNAENGGQILKKGMLVFFEGEIKTRTWKDKEGNDRQTTEILANNFQIVASPRDSGEAKPMPQRNADIPPKAKPAPQPQAQQDDFDQEIPF